jgi:predicted aspartyl protease
MPICNRGHLQVTPAGIEGNPSQLRIEGARIACEVRTDPRDVLALQASGRAIPPGVSGILLVDTGAGMTAIDESILADLGIPSITDTRVFTPMGSAIQSVYSCSLEFPGSNLPPARSLFVLGADLGSQGIVGLLGRDVLEQAVLVYNGTAGGWTLAF